MPTTLMHVISQIMELESSGLFFRKMIEADVTVCNALIAAISRISPEKEIVL